MNRELQKLLAKHDWTYEMSDDHNAWRKGNAERNAIFSNIRTLSDKIMVIGYAIRVPQDTRASFLARVEQTEALNG